MARPAVDEMADAKRSSLWLDAPDRPAFNPPLWGDESADLVVVGGGYTGLWTALLAKERDPRRDVVLIDRGRIPSAASGQNAGYLLGPLVDWFHLPYYPGQERQLAELGRENRCQILQALERYAIDCDVESTGWVVAARRDWQIPALRELWRVGDAAGLDGTVWDADAVREQLRCEALIGGLYQPDAVLLLHPVKLAWGLKRACEQLGVRIFEATTATSVDDAGGGVRVTTTDGSVTAAHAALATYAHPSLVTRLRWWHVPIYTHVLATAPLSEEQLDSLGWRNRQGFITLDPFYHYFRLTKDDRMIFGYLDGTVYPRRGVRREHEQDDAAFPAILAEFHRLFPQLDGVAITHRWGGALDHDSRQAPFFGTAHRGRVAYALGFHPGIGASRAGANVMLDLLGLLDGERSPYLDLPLVKGRGVYGRPSLRPFPGGPVLSLGLALARRGMRREQRTGDRGWAARAINRAGYRF